MTLVGGITAAAAVDPLVQPPKAVLREGFFQETPILLHAAFQNFISKENQAARSAVRRLANGQDPNSLLASLNTNTSLQGGILESKVEQISKRLPGGVQYLFDPPQGPVPLPPGSATLGFTTTFMSGPDLRYYVPPAFRLRMQIDNMLATLNANATTLQNAVSANMSVTILQTYQSSRMAMVQFADAALANGDFSLGPNQGPVT